MSSWKKNEVKTKSKAWNRSANLPLAKQLIANYNNDKLINDIIIRVSNAPVKDIRRCLQEFCTHAKNIDTFTQLKTAPSKIACGITNELESVASTSQRIQDVIAPQTDQLICEPQEAVQPASVNAIDVNVIILADGQNNIEPTLVSEITTDGLEGERSSICVENGEQPPNYNLVAMRVEMTQLQKEVINANVMVTELEREVQQQVPNVELNCNPLQEIGDVPADPQEVRDWIANLNMRLVALLEASRQTAYTIWTPIVVASNAIQNLNLWKDNMVRYEEALPLQDREINHYPLSEPSEETVRSITTSYQINKATIKDRYEYNGIKYVEEDLDKDPSKPVFKRRRIEKTAEVNWMKYLTKRDIPSTYEFCDADLVAYLRMYSFCEVKNVQLIRTMRTRAIRFMGEFDCKGYSMEDVYNIIGSSIAEALQPSEVEQLCMRRCQEGSNLLKRMQPFFQEGQYREQGLFSSPQSLNQ